MSSPRHISLLIGEIYDAILDRAQWIEALDKAAQFVGAQAGALIWRNPVCRAVNVIHAFGVEPGYVELYRKHYAKLDPTTALRVCTSLMASAGSTDLRARRIAGAAASASPLVRTTIDIPRCQA